MRSILLVVFAVIAFGITIAVETTDANAVVCADGFIRTNCASPGNGSGFTTRGTQRKQVCYYVIANGKRVRRCE